MGIEIDATNVPLRSLDRPVVSMFSTGILEAAALGLHAWSFAVGAPKWLQEFWQRYNINQWGGIPTPSPVRLSDEPALLVAQEMARIVLNKK